MQCIIIFLDYIIASLEKKPQFHNRHLNLHTMKEIYVFVVNYHLTKYKR